MGDLEDVWEEPTSYFITQGAVFILCKGAAFETLHLGRQDCGELDSRHLNYLLSAVHDQFPSRCRLHHERGGRGPGVARRGRGD